MLYLFIATLCSATIALVFKYASRYNYNKYLVTSINYLVAFLISLFMIVYKRLFVGIVRVKPFHHEIKSLLANNSYTLSPYGSIIWGIIIGSITGIFFFSSFIYYQKSIEENGVGIAGTFSKLGILLPMIISIVLWKEIPTIPQWTGIILSLISIVIVNLSSNSLVKFNFKPTIILLFILAGMAEFSNKVYQQYALNEYKDIFLFCVFLVAFSISIFFTLKEDIKNPKRDLLTGIAIGIPNLFSSYFLILSLDKLKASVVFPIFCAGSILLINIGGLLIFKELIAKKNKIAIGLIVIGLVLLNM